VRVIVIGLRGIPNIAGGVETHVEHLCPLLAELGCTMEVLARSTAWREDTPPSWQGVLIKPLWSPRRQGLEAFVHTFLGVLYAAVKRPDLLHIHAVGPMFMTPLARALGLRVVVTHHGPDYEREKWGKFSRAVLKAGERFGVRYANECIVISQLIRGMISRKHRRNAWLIRNGVDTPVVRKSQEVLAELGLTPQRYVLHVSRFVPEKRQLDLIEAFERAALPGWKLVLIGQVHDHERYSQQVIARAKSRPDVILAGFRTGTQLQELYTHAGFFVLPSSHEGLPIVLLEALSYGLKVLASDIAANLEVGLAPERYFPLGDANALAQALQRTAAEPWSEVESKRTRTWVTERYNWRDIAHATYEVYARAAGAAYPAPRRSAP
jgi:glycosyltransferase involved in cell wall biosynthesis